MSRKLKFGEKTHCRELNTGKHYTGFFSIENSKICTEIVSYDDFFVLPLDAPIFIQTSSLDIISLHSNAGPNFPNSFASIRGRTWTHSLISNIAVVGPHKWEPHDEIQRVTFSLPGAKYALVNFEIHKAIYSQKADSILSVDALRILFVQANHVKIGVSYSAHYNSLDSFAFNSVSDTDIYFEIQFDKGVNLQTYVEHVWSVMQFVSFLIGKYHFPEQICVSKAHDTDQVASEHEAIDEHGAIDYKNTFEYDVYYLNGSKSEDYAGAVYPLITVNSDEGVAVFKSCLIEWSNRRAEWQKANFFLITALKMKKDLSTERLLNACRWFEEIPLTRPKTFVEYETLQNIILATKNAATQLGCDSLNNRIQGALNSIGREETIERIKRLVSQVVKLFGDDVIGNSDVFTSFIYKGFVKFRGKIAHGHFFPKDDIEFNDYRNAIYGLEAICFLLTTYNLLLDKATVNRIREHYFVQNYRQAPK